MKPGTIGWHDLTVDDASGIRDFYAAVAGWTSQGIDMGGYEDFSMVADGDGVAGVCHRRGTNADLPSQWIMYVVVEDLDRSLDACAEGGGEIVAGPKSMGEARYAIIRDPAGADHGCDR